MKPVLRSEGALAIQVISEYEFLQETARLLSESLAALVWGSAPFSLIK